MAADRRYWHQVADPVGSSSLDRQHKIRLQRCRRDFARRSLNIAQTASRAHNEGLAAPRSTTSNMWTTKAKNLGRNDACAPVSRDESSPACLSLHAQAASGQEKEPRSQEAKMPRLLSKDGSACPRRGLADARGRARPSLLIMYTSVLGAQAAQVVGLGAWAVGEPIGAVCEGHGREL